MRRYLVTLFVLTCALQVLGSPPVFAGNSMITIQIDKQASILSCKVNGVQIEKVNRRCTVIALDRALGTIIKDRGHGQVILVLLGAEVPITDALQIKTIANKVGFQVVRFFIPSSGETSNSPVMTEVSLGKSFRGPKNGMVDELVANE